MNGRDELARRRVEYETAGLDVDDLAEDPITQWWRWYDEAVAAELTEPNNVVLATCGADGQPDARVVLLRGADARGFTFYSNFLSAKGRQIRENPRASLVFAWLELHRQVRVRGAISTFADGEADDYWASRPLDSQLASAASPQSQVIRDRAELDARIEVVRRKAAEGALARPAAWGGFRVVPDEVEFWQGRAARAHDRLLFSRIDGEWTIRRLAP